MHKSCSLCIHGKGSHEIFGCLSASYKFRFLLPRQAGDARSGHDSLPPTISLLPFIFLYPMFPGSPDLQERPLLLPDFFLIIHTVGRLDIHLLISSARNEINLQGTSFRPGSPIACVSIDISHIHMPASDTQNVALPYILLLLNFVVFNNF